MLIRGPTGAGKSWLALALIEMGVAKLRLFRVPELLAGSFALALLSVMAVFLVR